MPITSSRWETYPWKNELQAQMQRTIEHGVEILDDAFDADHSPLDMLERAIVLSAFSIRRMIEKRLVSDSFALAKRRLRSFKAVASADFRPPFRSQSGGSAFKNYDFGAPLMIDLAPGDLANEIIHSSQLMVLGGERFAEDGFLIASDLRLSRRVLHLSFAEFRAFAESVLSDEVALTSDEWDPATGKVTSRRLGPHELPRPKT